MSVDYHPNGQTSLASRAPKRLQQLHFFHVTSMAQHELSLETGTHRQVD